MVAKADISSVTKNMGGFQSPLGCNTTTTVLQADGVFFGQKETNGFPHVLVSIDTDQDGTLFFETSVDGINWIAEPVAGVAITANTPTEEVALIGPRPFRVRYVNGSGGTQTFFRLFTYFGFFFVNFINPTDNFMPIRSGTRFLDSPIRRDVSESILISTDLIIVPRKITDITATYTVLSADDLINATANTFTITLLTAIGMRGRVFTFKNSGGGTITVDAVIGEFVDGGAGFSLIAGASTTIVSDNVGWLII